MISVTPFLPFPIRDIRVIRSLLEFFHFSLRLALAPLPHSRYNAHP